MSTRTLYQLASSTKRELGRLLTTLEATEDAGEEGWFLWTPESPSPSASFCIEAMLLTGEVVEPALHHLSSGENKWGVTTFEERKQHTVYPAFSRWRWAGSPLPTPERQGRAIMVWSWSDAPGLLRSLSRECGGERRLALLPEGERDVPYWLESEAFGGARASEYAAPDGRVVCIGVK